VATCETIFQTTNISQYNKYCDFIYKLVSDYFEANGIDSWENFCYGDDVENEPIYFNGEICSGATKVVLVPYDMPFVIKIPFSGWREDWDGECIPFEEGFNSALEELGYSTQGNNYCDLEVNVYAASVQEGVSQFFAPTIFFDEINSFPIYIQTKITANTWATRKIKPKDNDTYTYASIKNSDMIDPECGTRLLQFYSVEEIARFLSFVKTYNIVDIDNFRNGGVAAEIGRYIFWDYSGYYER